MHTAGLLVLLGLSAADAKLDFEAKFDLRNKADVQRFTPDVNAKPPLYQADARGLHLRLPAKAGPNVETGASIKLPIYGDFEVVANYEILIPDKSAPGWGAGPTLWIGTASSPQSLAYLGYRLHSEAVEGLYSASGIAGSKDLANPSHTAGKGRRGRLRIARRSSVVTFSAADGEGPFQKLREVSFNKSDLSMIALRAQTGGAANGVEVIWTEMVVHTAAPRGTPIVQTIRDQRIAAKFTHIKDGKLFLASTPPREIPLDEISHLEIDRDDSLRVRWVGQVERDLVGASPKLGTNGVQDVQFSLSGLAAGKEIQQVRLVLVQPGGGALIWMFDTTKGPSWRMALERSGRSTTAEIFVEPSQEDMFDHVAGVTVTYGDGVSVAGSVKASTHTDYKRKMGSPNLGATSAPAKPAPVRLQVFLSNGDRLIGEMVRWDEAGLELRPEWGASLKLQASQVAAVQTLPLFSAAQPMFDERLRAPAVEDAALVRDKGDKTARVDGKVLGVRDGKVRFEFEGKERSLALAKFIGVVFAARAAAAGSASPFQTFDLSDGESISGVWSDFADGRFLIKTAAGAVVDLPVATVRKITFRNGKLLFLSDVAPTSAEEVPYFDKTWPYRRDQSLTGDKLSIKGATYAKGIAVHSRSVLTYTLDGGFQLFKTHVGFDDAAAPLGRVFCRVSADGKELFRNEDLRADAEPTEINVPVAGAKQLTLEVDFGQGEDVGDRVIWANPRLFRDMPAK